ncbi:MAG: hypothetical protein ACRDY6_05510 [Acidimicrobiia bacterium]
MSTKRTITQRALRVVAAGAVVAGVMLPAAAVAQQDPVYPTPTSTPKVTEPPRVSGAARPAVERPTRQDTLPVTGGQIAGLALIGLGITGAGVAMVRIGRRRATA